MLTYNLSRMSPDDLRTVLEREDVDLTSSLSSARQIIDDVRAKGDAALIGYARKYDGFKGRTLRVPESELRLAEKNIPRALLNAIRVAKSRIERFHSLQVIKPFEYRDECGTFGQRVKPLQRVGVYVPGGSASYVSSVLMACIPAKIAGVDEIALCTPGKDGKVADAILAAASICGVDEVYRVGGAQSISAMAYGTASIQKVQKIVGPGGTFVSAAKLLVRNDCEIDFLAGPSEVLVMADESANPDFIASEMLAQLEHDPLARAVLVTHSKSVLDASSDSLGRMISSAARSDVVNQSSVRGAIFIKTRNLKSTIEFANRYAPEHLVIDMKNPKGVMRSVQNAGSVFLGKYSSVSFGDYCAGTNHILPTKGIAAMKSSLSTYDFVKILPFQMLSRRGASTLSGTVQTLALAEGLPAHADAALLRTGKVKE